MTTSYDPAPSKARHILLVDGTCVFCNRLVAMILRRDVDGDRMFGQYEACVVPTGPERERFVE